MLLDRIEHVLKVDTTSPVAPQVIALVVIVVLPLDVAFTPFIPAIVIVVVPFRLIV